MIEYVSVIFDECGCVYCYCSDLKENEIEEILYMHPEFTRGVLEV